METQAFSVAPNPTSDLVTITTNSRIENVEIYNTLGEKVLQNAARSNEVTLDISTLVMGTYFMSVTSEGVVTTKKLLKI